MRLQEDGGLSEMFQLSLRESCAVLTSYCRASKFTHFGL
jgi:hypothetical protein